MNQLNCSNKQLTHVIYMFLNNHLKLVGIDYFDVHMFAQY
jgi:hypothetical protein